MTAGAAPEHHVLPLSAAFPTLGRCDPPADWDLESPVAAWRGRQEEIARMLATTYARIPDLRLVDLVPALLAELHTEIGFSGVEGVGRVDLEKLLIRGHTTWLSLLNLHWTDFVGRLRISEDGLQSLVRCAIRLTFQVVGSGQGGVARPADTDVLLGVLSHLTEVERRILIDRLSPFGQQATLAEIGERVGLTRERVRQLEAGLIPRLRNRMKSADAVAVVARARRLRRDLGTAVDRNSKRFEDAMNEAGIGLPEGAQSEGLALLFTLCGPYEQVDDWLLGGEFAVEDPRKLVRLLLTKAPTPVDDVLEAGVALGVHPDQMMALVQRQTTLTNLDGALYDLSPPVAEVAIRLLRTAGHPLTFDEIWVVLQHKSTVERSTRNALFAEPQLQRTTARTWALREWGLPEYTSVAGCMVGLIEAAGGRVVMETLIRQMAERFEVPRASVVIYAERPLFLRHKDGALSLRGDEPYEIRQSLDRLRHHRLSMDGSLVWRIRIDGELLRGSGRAVQEALAEALGLRPGRERGFRVEGRDLTIRWRPTGSPTVGSLRELVKHRGGGSGDWLVLRFTVGSTIEAQVVTQELMSSDQERAVAMLLGAPPLLIDQDPLEALSAELDVVAGNRRSAITRSLAELKRHGETDLVEILDSVDR